LAKSSWQCGYASWRQKPKKKTKREKGAGGTATAFLAQKTAGQMSGAINKLASATQMLLWAASAEAKSTSKSQVLLMANAIQGAKQLNIVFIAQRRRHCAN